MKQVVVSIYDSAAQAYGRPAFMPTRAMAVRSFVDEVKRAAPDNNMHNHPEDFTLVQLAEFDDATGVFTPAQDTLLRAKDVEI